MTGRPARASARILEATLELLTEEGYGGLTMEGVAARAGVGKATLYRHWGCLPPLVLDAIGTTMSAPVAPDTGSLRGDLVALLDALRRRLADDQLGRLVRALVDAAERDPQMAAVVERFTTERRSALRAVLRRAKDRGEVPADADVEVVIDLLAGPVFYRRLVTRKPVTRSTIEVIVDLVLRGLGTT